MQKRGRDEAGVHGGVRTMGGMMREEGTKEPSSWFQEVFKARRGWAFFFLKKSQIVS